MGLRGLSDSAANDAGRHGAEVGLLGPFKGQPGRDVRGGARGILARASTRLCGGLLQADRRGRC